MHCNYQNLTFTRGSTKAKKINYSYHKCHTLQVQASVPQESGDVKHLRHRQWDLRHPPASLLMTPSTVDLLGGRDATQRDHNSLQRWICTNLMKLNKVLHVCQGIPSNFVTFLLIDAICFPIQNIRVFSPSPFLHMQGYAMLQVQCCESSLLL